MSKGLLGMAPEVLEMIVSYVPLADKKNLRQVCRCLRDNIDEHGKVRYVAHLHNGTSETVRYLSLSRPGPIETLVVEAFNQPLKSTSSTRFVVTNGVNELILAGRSNCMETAVDPVDKHFVYPFLPNEGRARHSFSHWVSMENLTMGMGQLNLRYIVQFTNETVAKLVISSDIFSDPHINHSSTFSTPTLFPQLKSLEMVLLHHNDPRAHMCIRTGMDQVFGRRFPSLQRIMFKTLCGCTKLTIHQWIKFYGCLVAHRHTLNEVEISHHHHFDAKDFMSKETACSKEVEQLYKDLETIQLERLNLVILSSAVSWNEEKKVSPSSFEIKLLRSQTMLKILKLDFGYMFDNKRVFDFLPKNDHLEACSIHVFGAGSEEEYVKLDFVRDARALKFLQIVCQQDACIRSPWRLQKIEMLPTSIERLSLSASIRKQDADWIQKNLTNLKEIRYFGGIQRDGDYNTLSPNDIQDNNYHHFCNAVNKLPKLKSFFLARGNGIIEEYVKTGETKVQFRAYTMFTGDRVYYDLYH